jgi:hypothetical protein
MNKKHTGLFNNTRNIFAFMFAAFICFALFTGCKSHGTDPIETYKDPREMTWTVDTLRYPDADQTMMSNVLAFSSKDIFIYGFCSNTYGQVYHYDGTSWQLYNIAIQLKGRGISQIISLSRNSFYGVGEDAFYKSMVFSGDGTTWSILDIPKVNGMLTICASGSRNIYTGGRNGDIFHFDGSSWLYDYKRIVYEHGGEYFLKSSAMYKDTVHFLGSMWGITKNVFYHIKGRYQNWKVVDSMSLSAVSQNKWGEHQLYTSNTNRLFSVGYHGIWEYVNNGWSNLLPCTYSINGMFLLNDNYIIGCGEIGQLFFYDGGKWNKLTNFQTGYEDVMYQAAWGDGKELFVIGYTDNWPMKTIIWHGK